MSKAIYKASLSKPDLKWLKIDCVNMVSPASGNPVANQFIIEANGIKAFKSYNTLIAVVKEGQVFLDKYSWDYSQTTGKYRNQFLNEKKRETEKKIRSGEYKLIELN